MKRKNKNLLIALLLGTITVAVASCATSMKNKMQDEPYIVWPKPPDEPRIQFVQTVMAPADLGIQGSFWEHSLNFLAGRKEEYLKMPQLVTFGPSGRLYITDQSEKCLHIFDLTKKRYLKIENFDGEPISIPGGVTEGEDGRIYLADTVRKEIFVFDHKGKPLFTLGGPETFGRPTGLAYLVNQDRLYVVDTVDHCIKVFNGAGEFQFQFGKRGEEDGNFNFPTYISSDETNHLYITDTLNHRIQVFDSTGRFMTSFGKLGDSYGSFSKPKGVAVDSYGHIYVVDSLHDVVQIFNLEGQLLLSFSGPGNRKGQLWLPGGIAVDSRDRIYVADTCNRRIQIFQLLPEDGGQT